MNPSSKSKKKMKHLETKGKLRSRRTNDDDDDDQSESEEIMDGYDPVIKQVLARVGKRGDEKWRKQKDTKDQTSDVSENGDSDEDLEGKGATVSCFTTTALEEMERDLEQCLSYLEKLTKLEEIRELEELEDQLEKLKIWRKKGQKKGSQKAKNLEDKPLQSTDMSDILDKLPALQAGAHLWISKLEEISRGTQYTIGDIKRLLTNLIGIPAMEDIFQKARLNRYVGTAVHDLELLAASRSRLWRALRDGFLTNVQYSN